MTVYVHAHVNDEDNPYTRFGKLTFVDLAGSENLKKSGTTGFITRPLHGFTPNLILAGL